MDNKFDNGSPIYLQLLDHFRKLIISGKWPPGTRISAVRELALQFGVNPNTVQRALADLERDGLAQSERTNGRYITEDMSLIAEMRRQLAAEKVRGSVKDLSELGLNLAECLDMFTAHWPEKGTN